MAHTPILAGVVGWPISHSLSPLIHRVWAHRAGVDGYYIPLAIEPEFEKFAAAMRGLRKIGFAGVNVTIPHKEHALRFSTQASEAASRAGAANMLTFTEEGAHADNSDIAGFERAIGAKNERTYEGATALLLGAGGAARAVSIALKNKGFSKIWIANRSHDKAEAMAREFDLEPLDWGERQAGVNEADLVVNATSLGMKGSPPLDLNLDNAKQSAVIADIVYAPIETPLLKSARDKNHRTVDGLNMLMHQAAPGFRQWFKTDCDVDQALRDELAGAIARREAA